MLPGKADIGRPLAGELAGADARGFALRCCAASWPVSAAASLRRRSREGNHARTDRCRDAAGSRSEAQPGRI
jgi:hypothetical protein